MIALRIGGHVSKVPNPDIEDANFTDEIQKKMPPGAERQRRPVGLPPDHLSRRQSLSR
jgi:hypothetical protein